MFFANSGAEANECAIKLARRWGGPGALQASYRRSARSHGRTLATLHATGQPAKHEAFLPLPEGFSHVPYGDAGALRSINGSPRTRCCSSRSSASGRSAAAPGCCSRTCERSVTSSACSSSSTRMQPASAEHGAVVGLQREKVAQLVAKALGNGVPVGACWARPDRQGLPAGLMGRPSAGSRWRWPRRRRPCGDSRALDAPASRRGTRRTTEDPPRPSRRGRPRSAARGSCSASCSPDGVDARAVFSEALIGGLVVEHAVPGSSGSCHRSSSSPRTATRRWTARRRHRPRPRGRPAREKDRSDAQPAGGVGPSPTEITTVLDLSERPNLPGVLEVAARRSSSSSPVARGPATPRRWPSSTSAGTRSRSGARRSASTSRVGRGRGAHPRLLPPLHRRRVAEPRTLDRMAATLEDSGAHVPVVNLLLRPRAPDRGARRRADDPAVPRVARRKDTVATSVARTTSVAPSWPPARRSASRSSSPPRRVTSWTPALSWRRGRRGASWR